MAATQIEKGEHKHHLVLEVSLKKSHQSQSHKGHDQGVDELSSIHEELQEETSDDREVVASLGTSH